MVAHNFSLSFSLSFLCCPVTSRNKPLTHSPPLKIVGLSSANAASGAYKNLSYRHTGGEEVEPSIDRRQMNYMSGLDIKNECNRAFDDSTDDLRSYSPVNDNCATEVSAAGLRVLGDQGNVRCRNNQTDSFDIMKRERENKNRGDFEWNRGDIECNSGGNRNGKRNLDEIENQEIRDRAKKAK